MKEHFYEKKGHYKYTIHEPDPDFLDVEVDGRCCRSEYYICPLYQAHYFLPQYEEELDRFFCEDHYLYNDEENIARYGGSIELPCVVKCISIFCLDSWRNELEPEKFLIRRSLDFLKLRDFELSLLNGIRRSIDVMLEASLQD
jgi:hypothetical protein